jgi:hypothetical protein
VVVHVQHEVLPHHRQANQSDITGCCAQFNPRFVLNSYVTDCSRASLRQYNNT